MLPDSVTGMIIPGFHKYSGNNDVLLRIFSAAKTMGISVKWVL
ncbi:MAG: hypothetical protein Q8M15_00520 [Bacteroidota bacterium]|nr:hypothetical protein [Bacteroidota bacterium]